MWNDLVSKADAATGRLIAGCVDAAWRHPYAAAAFIGLLLVLAILLWVELIREAVAERRQAPADGRPIRLR